METYSYVTSHGYEVMWKNNVTAKQATDDHIIRRVGFAGWISKTTNTHSEYIIFFFILHGKSGYTNARDYYVYTYITCRVVSDNSYKDCCLLVCDFMQFCRTSNGRNLIPLEC